VARPATDPGAKASRCMGEGLRTVIHGQGNPESGASPKRTGRSVCAGASFHGPEFKCRPTDRRPDILAEDVNGANIVADANGTITQPRDIKYSATGSNWEVFTTTTNASPMRDGHGRWRLGDGSPTRLRRTPDKLHHGREHRQRIGLINGVCAATSAQMPACNTGLIRVLGRILGRGWLQANPNVLTRKTNSIERGLCGISFDGTLSIRSSA